MQTPTLYFRPLDDDADEYASHSDTSLEPSSILGRLSKARNVEHVKSHPNATTAIAMHLLNEPCITVLQLYRESHAVIDPFDASGDIPLRRTPLVWDGNAAGYN